MTWNGTGGVFVGTAGSQVATAGPVVDTTGSFTVAGWVDLAAAGSGSTQAVASQAAGTASGFALGYDSASGDWQFARPLADTAARRSPRPSRAPPRRPEPGRSWRAPSTPTPAR